MVSTGRRLTDQGRHPAVKSADFLTNFVLFRNPNQMRRRRTGEILEEEANELARLQAANERIVVDPFRDAI